MKLFLTFTLMSIIGSSYARDKSDSLSLEKPVLSFFKLFSKKKSEPNSLDNLLSSPGGTCQKDEEETESTPQVTIRKALPVIEPLPEYDGLPKFLVEALEKKINKKALDEDQYFVIIFGYEGENNFAKDSHTFSSYIKVSKNGKIKTDTISWLPEEFVNTESICVFQDFKQAIKYSLFGNPCESKKGYNYSLAQTLLWAKKHKRKMAQWGPFPISKKAYELGLARKSRIEKGDMMYLADDTDFRRVKNKEINTFNCYHAVSDLAPEYKLKDSPEVKAFVKKPWGISGTYSVVEHLIKSYQKEDPSSTISRSVSARGAKSEVTNFESFNEDLEAISKIVLSK